MGFDSPTAMQQGDGHQRHGADHQRSMRIQSHHSSATGSIASSSTQRL
jgi:hypothetical protein